MLCTFGYAHRGLTVRKHFVKFQFKRPFLTECEDICQLSWEGKSASQSCCETVLVYCIQVLSYWKWYSLSGTSSFEYQFLVPLLPLTFIYLFYFREKCLLPLQLALESKSVKLAQQALAGMQVWIWGGEERAGRGSRKGSRCQGELGFSFEKHYRKYVCLLVDVTMMFMFL